VIPALIIAASFQPDPSVLRRLFEEALARSERQYGATDARTAQAARDLGMFLGRQGETRAAEAALTEALQIDEAVFGASAPQTLSDVAELAGVTPQPEKEPLWLRAADSTDAGLAARALAALGEIHAAAGDRAGAAAFYRRALARQETASGHDTEPVAVCLNALAQLVEVKEGIPLLERALAIDRRVLGARHPQTATTEANLAGLLVHARRNGEAIRAAGEALSIFQETLGAEHPRCAITAGILAFALEAKGERARAEKMYRLAVTIDERSYGPRHPQTIGDMRALAEFLRTIGKVREAADLEKKAAASAPPGQR
jgi:tetratricopeptide (TPR) repeat protein